MHSLGTIRCLVTVDDQETHMIKETPVETAEVGPNPVSTEVKPFPNTDSLNLPNRPLQVPRERVSKTTRVMQLFTLVSMAAVATFICLGLAINFYFLPKWEKEFSQNPKAYGFELKCLTAAFYARILSQDGILTALDDFGCPGVFAPKSSSPQPKTDNSQIWKKRPQPNIPSETSPKEIK